MPTDPPGSTYRVQLHRGWTLHDAAAVVDYLATLGVTHLYCSPYLQTAPGLDHGYGVVDHSRVDEAMGGDDGRRALVAMLDAHGLQQILDIVPNHVSVAVPRANPWWWDVLRHGRASRYAHYFDVDWDAGPVVVPILGDDLKAVVERGELRVAGDALCYHDHELPLAPGTEGLPLPELLGRQHYRLCYWGEAAEALNYRRFFDVTTLAAIRVEADDVFADVHRLPGRWLADGSLAGVRVDHPDGLADPEAYFTQLRDLAGPDAWILAEKILHRGERLPETWPVDGTTGYDAANLVTGLFVDPAGEAALTRCYADFARVRHGWADVVADAKRLVLRDLLAAEMARLVRVVGGEATAQVHDALVELLVAMPVYRTYLRPGRPVRAADLAALGSALAAAREQAPGLVRVLTRLTQRLTSANPRELVARFQQTSGPVTAKGVEDTAFYRYHRLVALNEVGGDPGHWGTPVEEFHASCGRRQAAEPFGMTALSTHDTKRSEDVRARLAVLSEVPDEWAEAVRRWAALNQPHRTGRLPDRNIEYLLYQTLVGAHPLPLDRALAYAEKAAREAKQHTSWLDPNERHERALRQFVTGALSDPVFTAELAAFVDRIALAGWVTSLAQKLVQLTMPGVPDVYQGSELWDLSLVDPDNRRPVDYAVRRRLIAELDALSPEEIGARVSEGLPKLLVVQRTLSLRRDRPDLFGPAAGYEPLRAPDHAIAFARGGGAVTVVPRFVLRTAEGGVVGLPPGPWLDVFTGDPVAGGDVGLEDLLHRFPVALLVSTGS